MRQNFTKGQALSTIDFNRISSRLEKQLYDRVIKELVGGEAGVFPDGFDITVDSLGGMLTVSPGLGFVPIVADESAPSFVPVYAGSPFSRGIPTFIDAANKRVDLLVARPIRVNSTPIQRPFQDIDGTVTVRETSEFTDWGISLELVEGNVVSRSAADDIPDVPAGTLVLAELHLQHSPGDAEFLVDRRVILTDNSVTPGQLDDIHGVITPQIRPGGTPVDIYEAEFNFTGFHFGSGYVDLSGIEHATQSVGGELEEVPRNVAIVISSTDTDIHGGEVEVYMKMSPVGDNVRVVLNTPSGEHLLSEGIPGRSILSQQEGIVKLIVKINDDGTGELLPIPFTGGGGGGAAVVVDSLSQLLAALSDADGVDDGDKIPVWQMQTARRPSVSNYQSFSRVQEGAHIVDQDGTPPDDFIPVSYTDTDGEARNIFMVTSGDVTNAYSNRLLMDQSHAGADIGDSDRRGIVATNASGEHLNVALLIDPTTELTVLLAPEDSLQLNMHILSGISDRTISANFHANAGHLKVGGSYVPVGAYEFAIPPTQVANLFPNRPSVNGMPLLIASLTSVTAGVRAERLGLFFVDIAYASVSAGSRAKLLLVTTLIEKIRAAYLTELQGVENKLQAEIDGISGRGTPTAVNFTMDIESLSIPIRSLADIPPEDTRFNIVLDIRGTQNIPSEGLSVTINGSPLTIHGAVDYTPGSRAVEVSLSSSSHGNILRSAASRMQLEVQAHKGIVYTDRLIIALHEAVSVIPERLQGIPHLTDCRRSARSSAPAFVSRDTVDPTNLTLAAGNSNPLVGFDSGGNQISHTTSIEVDTADIAAADLVTVGTFSRNNGSFAIPSDAPTDVTLLQEYLKKIGEKDFYQDTLTISVTDQNTRTAIAAQGEVILEMGGEFVDAVFMGTAVTQPNMTFQLKRNYYTNGDGTTLDQRATRISGTVRIIAKARVVIDRERNSRFLFDRTDPIPEGFIEVATVGVTIERQNNVFACYRSADVARLLENKNTITWRPDALSSAAIISLSGGVANVFGTEVKILQNLRSFYALDGINTDGDYFVYHYLKEDGTIERTQLEPNYDDDKGSHHPYEAWRCVLRTRMRVTSNGRSRSRLDDYNHYPWQRFNSEVRIAQIESFLDFEAFSRGRVGGGATAYNPTPAVVSTSRGGTGTCTYDFATGYYREAPAIQALTRDDNFSNVFDRTSFSNTDRVNHVEFWAQNHGAGSVAPNGLNVTLQRTGNDARQVELDNLYSG